MQQFSSKIQRLKGRWKADFSGEFVCDRWRKSNGLRSLQIIGLIPLPALLHGLHEFRVNIHAQKQSAECPDAAEWVRVRLKDRWLRTVLIATFCRLAWLESAAALSNK